MKRHTFLRKNSQRTKEETRSSSPSRVERFPWGRSSPINSAENCEYAIGSVDESGHVTLNPEAEGIVDDSYLEEEIQRQMDTMRKRRALYTPVRPPIDP